MKWTEERRRRQAQRIHKWRPWEKSTGPKTASGKARSARNAFKGSVQQSLRHIAAIIAQIERERKHMNKQD